jgi:hypothetical protein
LGVIVDGIDPLKIALENLCAEKDSARALDFGCPVAKTRPDNRRTRMLRMNQVHVIRHKVLIERQSICAVLFANCWHEF